MFLFLLSLLILGFCRSELHSSKPVPNQFIISFETYLEQGQIRFLLESRLGRADETTFSTCETNRSTFWEIKKRESPAAHLPSDFAVVYFQGETNELKDRLKGCPFLKDISPEREYHNVHAAWQTEWENQLDITLNVSGRPHMSIPETESDVLHTSRSLHSSPLLVEMLNLDALWSRGYLGQNVKIGIFDTGLTPNHPHFHRVMQITDWTNQNTSLDSLGHGTFVSSVIGSTAPKCPGVAPNADLYIFRVFTEKQTTYTSWFLDAFNYAIHLGIHILNLSIGGPDFNDKPFVDKIMELSANNIIVVSAIGNDGPLYGTLNNPADQMDVIGVGSINFDDNLSPFSSRGMTTWEIPRGTGRVKPDLLTFGKRVSGSSVQGSCTTMSGTSVASPVVSGGVALLLSMLNQTERDLKANPASIKQVLLAGAQKIDQINIFEQGQGKMDLVKSAQLLSVYQPHASCFPSVLDLTQTYFWPHSAQPLFFGALPLVVNVTVLNGMGVSGQFLQEPTWRAGRNGDVLGLSFEHSEVLWPWSGYLAVRIKVQQEVDQPLEAQGIIRFAVISPPGLGEDDFRVSHVDLPLKVRVVPTPPRHLRILWDQFHSLRYPPGYFPRDALELTDQPFDWNGDHPHTNFKGFFEFARSRGYYVEVLGEPLTCFNASDFGTLMIVDPEAPFSASEIEKVSSDVHSHGLGLVFIGDWFSEEMTKQVEFHDEITRKLWTPLTGGCNLPASNQLLSSFGMALSDGVWSGTVVSGGSTRRSTTYASGSSIAQFPSPGLVLHAELADLLRKKKPSRVPILGFHSLPSSSSDATPGRVTLFGDSSCLDDAYLIPSHASSCFWIVDHMLEFSMHGLLPPRSAFQQLDPSWINQSNFPLANVSNVPSVCQTHVFQQTNSEPLTILWNPSDEQLHSLFPSSPVQEEPSTILSTRLLKFVPYFVAAICFIALLFIFYLSKTRTV